MNHEQREDFDVGRRMYRDGAPISDGLIYGSTFGRDAYLRWRNGWRAERAATEALTGRKAGQNSGIAAAECDKGASSKSDKGAA